MRESGWVDYIDLPEHEMSVASGSIGAGALSGPTLEVGEFQYNQAVAAHGETKLQLEATKDEVKQLKEELVEALNENQELRKQIRFKELEDKPADELKAILDGAEIKYKANAGKPELAQLVLDHESKGSE